MSDELTLPTANDSNEEVAKFWNVSAESIKRWRTAGAPVHDPQGMHDWSASTTIAARGFKDRIHDLRRRGLIVDKAQQPGESADGALFGDSDWARFQQQRRENGSKPAFDSIEELRDFYSFKLKEASATSARLTDLEFYTDQIIKLDRAIRENQLLAKKLGLQLGDTIGREIVERWIRAWIESVMRANDAFLDEVCPRIAESAQGMSPDQVRAILEPEMLERRLLLPFAKTFKPTAEALQAPKWAIDTAREALDELLEDGAQHFDHARGR